MAEDEIGLDELTRGLQATVSGKGSLTASESLGNFIDFALKERKAANYVLFLVGHGMIVGTDTFLPTTTRFQQSLSRT